MKDTEFEQQSLNLNKLKMQNQQTIGQQVIRVSFNPSNNSEVDEVKQMYADLYDRVHKLYVEQVTGHQNPLNWLVRALNHIEDSAMLTVKSLTDTKPV